MSEYEMRLGQRRMRCWTDKLCFPAKDVMEAMYRDGQKLYIDDVRKTKAEALALCPSKPRTTPDE